jgi:hypothetical protein
MLRAHFRRATPVPMQMPFPTDASYCCNSVFPAALLHLFFHHKKTSTDREQRVRTPAGLRSDLKNTLLYRSARSVFLKCSVHQLDALA